MIVDHDPGDEHVGELITCQCGRPLNLTPDQTTTVNDVPCLSGMCRCGLWIARPVFAPPAVIS